MNLTDFYILNFQLMHNHKYSLTELENLIPWEKEIYLALLRASLIEENMKIQQKLAERG
tara:strand:+ start:5971 stop:6147 length:177 start_codon:yes stop_codon:yes gene_type:complete